MARDRGRRGRPRAAELGDEYTLLPRVYRAATPGGIHALRGNQATSIRIIVRTRGGPPPMFMRRLPDIVASVEPGFQLERLENFAEDRRAELRTLRTAAVSIAVAMLSVLLLSAARRRPVTTAPPHPLEGELPRA